MPGDGCAGLRCIQIQKEKVLEKVVSVLNNSKIINFTWLVPSLIFLISTVLAASALARRLLRERDDTPTGILDERQVARPARYQVRDQEPAKCPKCGQGHLVRVEILEPPYEVVDGIDSS